MDADKLVGELTKLVSEKQITTDDIDKALANYETDMVARGSAACLASRKTAWDNHNPDKLFRFKRHIMLKTWNWKLNVYEASKTVQWTLKLALASFVVLLLAFLYSFFTR